MLSSRSHQSPYPIQHAFVVQCEANTALDGESLAGRVEHIVSGQAAHFASLRELLEFMAQVLRQG
jgi:hypothetical protein